MVVFSKIMCYPCSERGEDMIMIIAGIIGIAIIVAVIAAIATVVSISGVVAREDEE